MLGELFCQSLYGSVSAFKAGRIYVWMSSAIMSSSLRSSPKRDNIWRLVVLTARETMSVISSCHKISVRGGGIYDCLHIDAARKAGCDELLTLNLRHFVAFAPDLAFAIREP